MDWDKREPIIFRNQKNHEASFKYAPKLLLSYLVPHSQKSPRAVRPEAAELVARLIAAGLVAESRDMAMDVSLPPNREAPAA